MIYSSSDELVKERYAVQAIPITDTNGWEASATLAQLLPTGWNWTYNLKLDRDNPEIENLDSRPEGIVGLQGGQVDILEFASQSPSASALSEGHEREEAHQT